MTPFDAYIDLTERRIPVGLPPAEAVRRVQTIIRAIPGAHKVSVNWCGSVQPVAAWVRTYKAGGFSSLAHQAGERLVKAIAVEVRCELFCRLELVTEAFSGSDYHTAQQVRQSLIVAHPSLREVLTG